MARTTIKPITERDWKITIPLYDNSGNKIKVDVLKEFINKINNHFGGSTILKVGGCYSDGGKTMCEENILILTSRDFDNPYVDTGLIGEFKKKCSARRDSEECIRLANKILSEDREFMKKLAEEIGRKLGQDSVYVSEGISQDVSLVKGEWLERLSSDKVLSSGEAFFKRLLI